MAVRKRGKGYVVDWTDPETKKRYVRKVSLKWAEAKQFEADVKAGVLKFRQFGRKEVSSMPGQFKPLVELYMEWYEKEHRPKSVELEQLLADTAIAHFGERLVSDIDRRAVEMYLAARKNTPTRGGSIRSAATVRHEVKFLSRLFNKAAEWGLPVRNPVKGIRLPKPSERDRILDLKEATSLLNAAVPPMRLLIYFALYTAMRVSEIIALRWTDVDLERHEILTIGKGGKKRYVPIADRLNERLADESFFPRTGEFVFTTVRGTPYADHRSKAFRSAWSAACKQAGLEDITFHDLRRTAASWMAVRGVPMNVVKEILGHSDINITARIYARALGEHRLAGVNTLDWESRTSSPEVRDVGGEDGSSSTCPARRSADGNNS